MFQHKARIQDHEESPRVCVTPPGVTLTNTIKVLGPRIFVGRWPSARVSILSSRLPRRKDTVPWWFDALRTVAIRSATDGASLLCVPGATASDFMRRLCELLQLPSLKFRLPDRESMATESIAEWLAINSPESEEIAVSPRIELTDCAPAADLSSLPLPDRILAVCGTRLVGLHTTVNGNCQQLLHNQITTGKPVMLVALRGRKNPASADRSLVAAGAIPWILEPLATPAQDESNSSNRTVTLKHGPLTHPSEWLCHWTRPHRGPWSDQSENEYLDELLLRSELADRSALASLIRIVATQRIETTVLTLETKAVSWTAVPLNEFRHRRIFRRHKQHFDFEPWGIAVRKEWLEQNGCRSVQYVVDQGQESRGNSWLHQPARSRNGKIDWREEKEWRSPNRVVLAAACPGDVVVFVDQLSQVPERLTELVQQHGWTIVAVPNPDSDETDKT